MTTTDNLRHMIHEARVNTKNKYLSNSVVVPADKLRISLAENEAMEKRVSELESVNVDLYEALLVAMQSINPANYTDLTVCNEALAKVQEKELPR